MTELRGTVIGVNKRRGYLAVQIDDGPVSVLELTSGPMPAVDDRGRGDLTGLANGVVRNMSRECDFRARVHATACNLATALGLLNR